MGWFEKQQSYEGKKALADLEENLIAPLQTEEPQEEWVWINGFKGTDKDMKCRDYQFDMEQTFNMPEDAPIVPCSSGFHLCKELTDVFDYYDVRSRNRFFEVYAEVRKSDLDNYRPTYTYNKLVARSIKFISEITVDDVIAAYFAKDAKSSKRLEKFGFVLSDFTTEHKKIAVAEDVNTALNHVATSKLETLGYSAAFANLIVRRGGYDVARAVGTQSDLSMDMKAMYIYQALEQKYDEELRRYEDRRRRPMMRPSYNF